MAYIEQNVLDGMMPFFRAAFRKYNIKGDIIIRHNMSLVITLKRGPFRELVGMDGDDITVYARKSNSDTPPAQNPTIISMINELLAIANEGNWDKNFRVGWRVELRAGVWGKPFKAAKIIVQDA